MGLIWNFSKYVFNVSNVLFWSHMSFCSIIGQFEEVFDDYFNFSKSCPKLPIFLFWAIPGMGQIWKLSKYFFKVLNVLFWSRKSLCSIIGQFEEVFDNNFRFSKNFQNCPFFYFEPYPAWAKFEIFQNIFSRS